MTDAASQLELLDAGELGSPALAEPWRRLAVERSNPFATPEWARAWLLSHPDEEPFLLGWWVEGELRGVLPLVRERVGPARVLRFVGSRRADWTSPVCAAADEAAMAAALARFLAGRRDWHALRLDRLDGASSWPTELRPAGRMPIVALGPRRRDVLPYIAFDERGFEGYLADRSRNFRSQLGRRRRKLERDHGLAFRRTESSERLAADLDTFFRLHDLRWEAKGGSSSKDEATRAHQRAFAAAALEQGWLRLWIAEADGEPAAAWYGWRIGERYCYALAGLDPRYEDRALGTVLLGHTIADAAAEGAAVYDMMWGDEGYKKRFETDRREAATWLLAGRRRAPRFVLGAGMSAAGRIEALPPRVRDPLAAAARAVRR